MSSRSIILIALVAIAGCISCNPFAPGYDPEGLKDRNLLGNRASIDGLFDYFENAYEIRDTTLYSKLFTNDFIFTYYDFDQAAEVSWDKPTEMRLSYNLFRSVQQITLDWNFYIQKDTTPTEANIVRNFNLTIVETETQIYTGTGRARIKARRSNPDEPWLIYSWFDDSDF